MSFDGSLSYHPCNLVTLPVTSLLTGANKVPLYHGIIRLSFQSLLEIYFKYWRRFNILASNELSMAFGIVTVIFA